MQGKPETATRPLAVSDLGNRLRGSTRRSLASEIHTILRSQIVDGSIPPATRLSEVTLAENLGVSRTPIREALQKLEQEGLAERRHGLGLFVAGLTRRGATEVVGIRSVLEGYAARLAAERITPEELASIRAAHDDANRAIEAGALEELMEANTHFHDGVNAASHSDRCVAMIGELRDWVLRYRAEALVEDAARSRSYAQHAQIIAALESRDGQLAEELARAHIFDSMAAVIEHAFSD
jgi:DNA-binding GntR family transcriptional regulator